MDARTLHAGRLTLPISVKIAASFGALLLIVIAVGGLSLNRLSAIEARAVAARDDWLPSARTLGQLRTTVRKYRLAEAMLGLARTRVRSPPRARSCTPSPPTSIRRAHAASPS